MAKQSIASIKKHVLACVTPKQSDRKQALAFVTQLNKKVSVMTPHVKFVLGGSLGKNTHIANNHDYDVFALFDYDMFKTKNETLSQHLAHILDIMSVAYKTAHGSRDYFQSTIIPDNSHNKVTVEFVPVLHITKAEQQLNITDCSPLHLKWFSNVKTDRLCDEIRITKLFLQANNLYGAESYIGGFSGHVVDILVARFGSFEKVLRFLSGIKDQTVVDISKYYGNAYAALKALNRTKKLGKLVIIDPVDKQRNAAAALDDDILEQAGAVAAQFLKNPNKNMFVKKTLNIKELKKQHKKHIVITIKPTAQKQDVAGAKLKKTFELLVKSITEQGFGVTYSTWEWDGDIKNDAILFIAVESARSPKTITKLGPRKTDAKNHIASFKKTNEKGKISIVDGRYQVVLTVPSKTLKVFVKSILDNQQKQKIIRSYAM